MATTDKNLLINQGLLKTLFDYNPETGVLTHKRREGTGSHAVVFNKTYAGHPAGSVQNNGYAQVSVKTTLGTKSYLAHRVIFLLAHGHLPEEIDHVNRDRLDNRIDNLRAATHSQNQACKKVKKAAKSGFRGVWHVQPRGVWRAQGSQDGKTKTLGYFAAPEDAARAYNDYALERFGEFAALNDV